MGTFISVDDYLNSLEPHILEPLNTVRKLILSIDDHITEYSAYGIIGYKYHAKLFYIGGYKTHIGLYGNIAQAITHYKDALTPYKLSKGTIQFPLNKPLPMELIESIVKYIFVL